MRLQLKVALDAISTPSRRAASSAGGEYVGLGP